MKPVYIDLRFLIPFAMPFVFLEALRLLWFVAGADWSEPHLGAVMSLLFGGPMGLAVATYLFDKKISFGFWLGGKPK